MRNSFIEPYLKCLTPDCQSEMIIISDTMCYQQYECSPLRALEPLFLISGLISGNRTSLNRDLQTCRVNNIIDDLIFHRNHRITAVRQFDIGFNKK